MIKFHMLFGTYLSFGLLIQAHRFSTFKKGIFSEVGLLGSLLVLLSILYFLITVFILLKKDGLRDKVPGILSSIFKKKYIIGVSLLIFILISFSLKLFSQNRNFYSLEKNPLVEIAFTSFMGLSAGHPEKEKREGNVQRKIRKKLYDISLIDQKIRKGIQLKNISLKKRKNMNLIIFKLESTCRDYIGYFNPEFKKFTPNIDKLCGSSLVLSEHYCQEPASLKALYSVLTGRGSFKTRNWKEYITRAEKDFSIAEILKREGYDTIFITSGDGRIYFQNKFLKNRFESIIDVEYIKKQGWDFKDFGICIDDRVLVKLTDEYIKKFLS
ncbi:MAG: sulfatase-like hydrolase/transferase, partial [Actinomycetia bacterium]|nr:sulfatase-like hydrolase/transferase [Actinomycetes bacterium]